MPPPARTPRLHSIDVERVVDSTTAAVAEHVSRLASRVGGARPVMPRKAKSSSGLAEDIRTVYRWARFGDGTLEDVDGASFRVASTLYPGALDGTGYEVGAIATDADPATDIGLLLVAGTARVLIARNEPLDTRELAALAGLSTLQIRNLIRQGDINAKDGEISAADARQFLRMRGDEALMSSRCIECGADLDLAIRDGRPLSRAADRTDPRTGEPGMVCPECQA